MYKVAIVNSSSFGNVFPQHLIALQEFAEVEKIKVNIDIDSDSFAKILHPFDGIIASVNPNFLAGTLRQLDRLKIIARHGIGYNNVDVETATELGIIVTKVNGPVERNAVAEHAVALMMSASRCIPEARVAVKSSSWSARAAFIGSELTGKTFGIVGLGNIGSRTAEIICAGFAGKILVVDQNQAEMKNQYPNYEFVSLEEMLARADFISLHCSLSKNNYHLLNSERFKLMKKGVILVNTARGELIDDQAIIPFLESKHIRAYAADVVENEPIAGSHPLLKLDNVIVVPHLGAYTDESLFAMGETMVNNVRTALVDKKIPLDNLIDPTLLEKKTRL